MAANKRIFVLTIIRSKLLESKLLEGSQNVDHFSDDALAHTKKLGWTYS